MIETYFHSMWGHPFLDASAAYAARFGLIPCVAALAVAWLLRRPRGSIVLMIAAAVAAFGAVVVAGLAYHEARPFVALGVTPLVSHTPDNAFPSDHSAVAAYAATFAAFFDVRLGVVAWAGAIVLGLARMYCLLHTPVDVAGGWVLGALPAAIAGFLWKKRRTPA